MWLIILFTVLLFFALLFVVVKAHIVQKFLIALCVLFLWNQCVLSDIKSWLFVAFLLFLSLVAYKYRKVKAILLCLGIALLIIVTSPLIGCFQFGKDDSNMTVSEDTVASRDNIIPQELTGVRMGDAYKGNFNALQGCCLYDGKLYQFFNNGYYEVRNADNIQLEREGRIVLPVRIHYGSVQFGNNINHECSMPYLYATDDASSEGNVYVIDFEKQKIIANYNVVGGGIAAYDFSKNEGYLICSGEGILEVTSFDLVSGDKKGTIKLQSNSSLETLQSAVFHNGYIFILSGYTGRSLIITKVDVVNKRIVARRDYGFGGEPEGIFFREDGKIVVTAAVGSWTAGKGSDKYIHSEYLVLDSISL